ncbi:MAG: uracil-DNA glycosylase [Planctomycetes bacterium]|nr:uracil-DNA glycosylase [Planctomycetota bacterium]
MEFDPGPPEPFASHFGALKNLPSSYRPRFWYDWGPIFYRGRLDGTARVLVIASDPGPTERIAHRTLVGDAGQRVQGFLQKLGLARSYLCVNAFPWALIPAESSHARAMLRSKRFKSWRNTFYDLCAASPLQAIVAFGNIAQDALALWPGRGTLPTFELPHPSSRDESALLGQWRAAVTALRAIVTRDADVESLPGNYTTTFRASDHAVVPRRDLPFGVPDFVGDDRWLRELVPPHRSSVSRPRPDDRHTLIWRAPGR